MMIIKPYSAVRDDVFLASEYPSCKLFFNCNERTGNSLVDSVSGLSVATGLTLGWSVSNAVRMSATATNVALGKTIVVGTKSALLMVVGNLGTLSQVNLGVASTMKLSVGSASWSASDGTNTAAVTTPTTGSILGFGSAFVSGTSNEVTAYQSSTTAWTAPANGTAAPADLTDIGNITYLSSFGSTIGNFDLYGMALFVFENGLPSNIAPAIQWMTAEWQRGNKAIYPGWKGLP